MPRLVLIRHGETEWSASGKHTSVTDVPLLDAGRRDAARLRERLAGREFALVLSSPRARARETATLAGLEAEVDNDLAEFDYGVYEGRTTPEIREERPGWSVWADGAPGGETAFAVGVRAARWIGLPAVFGGHLGLETGSVCELGFERERRVIWLWNDTSHLRG